MIFSEHDRTPAPVQPDPTPDCVADTGLDPALLHALLAKHLHVGGNQSVASLADRMALRAPVVSELVSTLLDVGLLHADASGDGALTFGLNARGRAFAVAAQIHDRYVGPAPLSTAHYGRLVEANSRLGHPLTRSQLHGAFADVVIDDDTLDRLGHGLNSSRPLLLHGPSGAGKTYLCERLTRLLDGATLIPYALAVGDCCIAVYDPALHDALAPAHAAACGDESDPRLLCCRRPALLVGAELNSAMLDIAVDAGAGVAQAPLPLRANNGLLILDDFGRQRIPADELMRRLALPIDTHRDWIRLDGAFSTEVPFDARLVLATNLELDELANDAFRRQLTHRIPLGEVADDSYVELWRRACADLDIPFDPALPEFALGVLHRHSEVTPLAGHPAELLARMLEQARYDGTGTALTPAMLERAWRERLPAAASPAHQTH